MKHKIYKNRKKILFTGIFLTVLGVIVGYCKYGTEPWETIGGFLSGFGVATSIITFGFKDPANK
ncbi:hypothetical protein [Tenacibaculum haliotis]|uniref:hypothetical protein n=1 Tax=Tenacibaculum haliotis TaxID=1888914 RepID=UPI0021AFCDF2|nr:hypothetical protein [Tenacibaculum haliotis]MCT4698357.1 hypothetical protein [Tenacibaculum haliotis]